jgi:hypothetical protein
MRDYAGYRSFGESGSLRCTQPPGPLFSSIFCEGGCATDPHIARQEGFEPSREGFGDLPTQPALWHRAGTNPGFLSGSEKTREPGAGKVNLLPRLVERRREEDPATSDAFRPPVHFLVVDGDQPRIQRILIQELLIDWRVVSGDAGNESAPISSVGVPLTCGTCVRMPNRECCSDMLAGPHLRKNKMKENPEGAVHYVLG